MSYPRSGSKRSSSWVARVVPSAAHEREVIASQPTISYAGQHVGVVGEQESDPLPARHHGPSYVLGVSGGNGGAFPTTRGALPYRLRRRPAAADEIGSCENHDDCDCSVQQKPGPPAVRCEHKQHITSVLG